MFSKILVKLIDQSVIPAILLLTARIVSVVLISRNLGIQYSLGASGFEFASQSDYVLVNSYSTLLMVVVLALGLFYIILKSLVFHESHISPRLTAKLFSLRLPAFIQNSFELFSQGVVWLSYLFLLMLVSGVMSLFDLMFSWVFYVSLVLSVVATSIIVLDVEKEVRLSDEAKEGSEGDISLNYGDDYE
ncbi:MAG: hypothetical protein WC243_00680 [Patescibacteria group bacterium]|jgi:hypothetical protein